MKVLALPKVRAALLRIESGEYGICIDCAEEISQARLKLVAAASRCTPCQEKAEKKYAA